MLTKDIHYIRISLKGTLKQFKEVEMDIQDIKYVFLGIGIIIGYCAACCSDWWRR